MSEKFWFKAWAIAMNTKNKLLIERDEARRVACQWYREAQSLKILHEYDLETINCYRSNNMEYYRRAEAAEKRIKELERALTDAEQTLRNISNELIGGDLPQIAHNTAQNIFFLLNKK